MKKWACEMHGDQARVMDAESEDYAAAAYASAVAHELFGESRGFATNVRLWSEPFGVTHAPTYRAWVQRGPKWREGQKDEEGGGGREIFFTVEVTDDQS